MRVSANFDLYPLSYLYVETYFTAIDARCLFLIFKTLQARIPMLNKVIEKSIATNNFLKRGANVK